LRLPVDHAGPAPNYIFPPDSRPEPGEFFWAFSGGFFLAGVAGFINICVLGYFDVPVSYMTDAVSRLGSDAEARVFIDTVFILYIIGGFLAGAVLSGILIGGKRLLPGRRYGSALVIESLMLGGAAWLLLIHNDYGVPLAAMACGIQNGMASSYYGLIVRTTHMTGIVTDIGVMIGLWFRHGDFPFWRIMFLLIILTGFFAGVVFGALTFRLEGMVALYLPAVACFLAGTGYFIWRQLTPYKE
jgi:uncharacterized membrane protein YoaK (UPF0700 family)